MGTDRVEVREVRGKGKGLFSGVPFKSGDFVAEYSGMKIPTTEANTSSSRYLFEIDDTWTIDGSDESNLGRWVNHSCDPNCEASIEQGRIIIRAARSIERGVELTIDYDQEYFNEFLKEVCACSTVRCRSRAAN